MVLCRNVLALEDRLSDSCLSHEDNTILRRLVELILDGQRVWIMLRTLLIKVRGLYHPSKIGP